MYNFKDFTEEHYKKLLSLAKDKYVFITYDQYNDKSIENKILWRHDIDFSPNRALALAKIENTFNVKATYFLHLHSEFYNLLEKDILEKVYDILSLGHEIGLHFDPGCFKLKNNNDSYFQAYLKMEIDLLEKIFETKVKVFSFHNPTTGNYIDIKQEKICGIINAYSSYLSANFEYCSDSNGYWRFKRLYDVITKSKSKRLHILTHPVWWMPDEVGPISPRQRVNRHINGRAAFENCFYDALMKNMGRKNI